MKVITSSLRSITTSPGVEMRTYIAFVPLLTLALACLGQDGLSLDPESGKIEERKRRRVNVELSSPVSYKASVSEVMPIAATAFKVKDIKPIEWSTPIEYNIAAVSSIELAVAISPEVLDLLAIAIGKPAEEQVPFIAHIELAKTDSVDIPNVFATEMAKVEKFDVPTVFESALAKTDPVYVPNVFTTEIAKVEKFDVPNVFTTEMAKVEKFDVPTVFESALANIEYSQLPDLLEIDLDKATETRIPYIAAATYAELVRSTVKKCSPIDLSKIKIEWYEIFQAKGGSKMWWILYMARMRAERGEDVSGLKKAFYKTMNKWLLEDFERPLYIKP